MKKRNLVYFVEGECEQKLVNTIKNKYIHSGKIKIKSVSQSKISGAELRTFEKGTLCIMIVDTDKFIENNKCVQRALENEKILKKYGIDYIFLYQDKDLEDEIVKSTLLNNILNMYKVKSKTEHKREFLKSKQLLKELENLGFDIFKIWQYQNKELPNKSNKNLDIKIK